MKLELKRGFPGRLRWAALLLGQIRYKDERCGGQALLSAEALGKFSIKESAPKPGLRARLGEEHRRGALEF